MKRSNKKGFTIVELVIVIAVIAILASILIPTFSNVVANANAKKALLQARNELTNAKTVILADGVVVYEEADGYTTDDKVAGNYVIVTATEGTKTTTTTKYLKVDGKEYEYSITTDNFIFYIGKEDVLVAVSAKDATSFFAKYTYKVADGAITEAVAGTASTLATAVYSSVTKEVTEAPAAG